MSSKPVASSGQPEASRTPPLAAQHRGRNESSFEPSGPAQPSPQERERRGQLWVLWAVALLTLAAAILRAGWSNVFLPGWWHIDLP